MKNKDKDMKKELQRYLDCLKKAKKGEECYDSDDIADDE